MENSVWIKQAGVEDVPHLALLFNQYRMFYGQSSNLDGAATFLEERITHKESTAFIAYSSPEDRRGLGFVQLYPSFSSVSMQRLWILNDLFVTSEARKQRVGRQLMDMAYRFALESSAKGLTLSTAHDNKIAQRLYESLGYERDEHFYTYELYFKG